MTATATIHSSPRPAPGGGFLQDHPWDRNFFLSWVALIWLGVLMGFVPEVVRHVAEHQRPFPPIIHVHGAVFVGWLVLLTTQVGLIRAGRADLHMRLGLAAVGLAALMMLIGPATAIVMDRREFGTPDDNTPFLFVQMSDMLSFGVLAGAGLALRRVPAAHKRLMLLATIYISDAGFSRWLAAGIDARFGHSFWPYFAGLYLGSDLLVLGLGGYDLVTRRRLHPAYVVGLAWIAMIQVVSVHFRWDPAWKVAATHLLGH